jgi:hypothetical protein
MSDLELVYFISDIDNEFWVEMHSSYLLFQSLIDNMLFEFSLLFLALVLATRWLGISLHILSFHAKRTVFI